MHVVQKPKIYNTLRITWKELQLTGKVEPKTVLDNSSTGG